MKVRMLVAHYHEPFEGALAPSVLLATDEFSMEENPDWWPKEVARLRAELGSEIAAWADVTIEVPTAALMAALYPANTAIPATVVATDQPID